MFISNSLSDSELITLLKKGAVGVLPTDTVYGLVCLASDQAAVTRLYKLKSRDHKPGTIIATDIEQLISLGLTQRYLKAVVNFWPGAVSVIIPCGQELLYLHRGKYGLAVRVIADEALHKLLAKTGPLLTTSANSPGELVATTIEKARHYFGQSVDFYVDGGDLTGNSPSTVIRMVDDAIEIVRYGAVKIDPETGEIKNEV